MFDRSKMRVVGTGLQFPEGPVVEASGSILVCEVEGGALVRVSPEGVRTVVTELGTGANGAAFGPDGSLYVATNGGFVFSRIDGMNTPVALIDHYVGGAIHRVDTATGEAEELFTESDGLHLGALNDVVFDADGGAYIADTTNGLLHYMVPTQRQIAVASSDVTTPNGVGLSPDGAQLYVSETFTGRLRVFDVVGPGKLAPLADLYQHPASVTARDSDADIDLTQANRFWDGLAVDGAGNVVVADLAASGVQVIDPHGTPLAHVETLLPDPSVTCLAFGGPDGNTAYVTCGGRGELLAIDWPWPGGRLNFQPSSLY